MQNLYTIVVGFFFCLMCFVWDSWGFILPYVCAKAD